MPSPVVDPSFVLPRVPKVVAFHLFGTPKNRECKSSVSFVVFFHFRLYAASFPEKFTRFSPGEVLFSDQIVYIVRFPQNACCNTQYSLLVAGHRAWNSLCLSCLQCLRILLTDECPLPRFEELTAVAVHQRSRDTSLFRVEYPGA